MNEETFNKIHWPKEFVIKFNDGKRQDFISSQGVVWDDGRDNEGCRENRPSISCCWKKKSESQQKYKSIEFFTDEIKSIETISGSIIWSANV